MIANILTYELKVAVLLAAFYMFYRLLLSKETFHRLNRCILLFTAAASFVLPFCVITIERTGGLNAEIGQLMMMRLADGGIAGLTDEGDGEAEWWQIVLLAVMAVGFVAVNVKTALAITGINRLIRNGERKFLADGTEIIINRNKEEGPFSWMRYIVLNEEDYGEMERSIILHEQGHISYGHSWDIILTDLLTSLQWFNPAIWMLKADLRALHEYQADDFALRGGIDAKEYQLLLIKKAISMSGYSVANGFNHSILKNRIAMMLKGESSVRSLMKSLYLIPAVGISLTAFAETKAVYDKVDEKVTETATGGKVTEENRTLQEKPQENDSVFMIVERMPLYPGGEEALWKYLSQEVKYPKEAAKQGVEGTVFVGFIVGADGNVRNVEVKRKINDDLDMEAVRVVSSMPKWVPGVNRDGINVAVSYVVPIKFKLTD